MTDNSKSPVLWSRAGVVNDVFVPVETPEAITDHKAVLLPLSVWLQLDERKRRFRNIRIGVRIEAADALDPLLNDLQHIALVVLDFPAFNDGRSFSKAAQLRAHYGFFGELRASGMVRIDQVGAMLRAGFDTLEISDALTLARLQAGDLHDTGVYYQPVAGGIFGAEKKAEGFRWRRRIS